MNIESTSPQPSPQRRGEPFIYCNGNGTASFTQKHPRPELRLCKTFCMRKKARLLM